MPQVAQAFYRIAVALWFGGMAVFTLVMTPVIFRTQPRETAARVVGAMMPVYFRYAIFVVAAALAARFAAGWGLSGLQPSLGTVILGLALAANLWQAFVLVPRMERVKAAIPSFEPGDAHHPARREFGRLHAFSMTVNFLLMAAAALLVAAQDVFAP
ncbi:MAG: DUF4149 domain-containing protein [Gemmatimonadota bacterium]